MENQFTFNQFLSDIEENSDRIISGGYIGLKDNKKIFFYISEDKGNITQSSKLDENQYSIRINTETLESIFKLINEDVRKYYVLASYSNNLTEEYFIRFVTNVCSEMLFWHEYSHISRGHFEYIEFKKQNGQYDLSCQRSIELDADVYGASFLFSRTYAIYLDKKSRCSLETLMQCYSIGIRSFFEVLHRNQISEDDFHKSHTHPHSLLRAYSAISHALTGPVLEKLDPLNSTLCVNIAIGELLKFESSNYCRTIDVDMLKEYVSSEWEIYHLSKSELDKYSILSVQRAPIITKIREYWRSVKLKT